MCPDLCIAARRDITDLLDAVGNTTKATTKASGSWRCRRFRLEPSLGVQPSQPGVEECPTPPRLPLPASAPHPPSRPRLPQGYAIGSAGLASFLLFSAYLDEVAAFSGAPFTQVGEVAQGAPSSLLLPAKGQRATGQQPRGAHLAAAPTCLPPL